MSYRKASKAGGSVPLAEAVAMPPNLAMCPLFATGGLYPATWGDPTTPALATVAMARAHPRDPRSPEALYWLIRIARWGGNHDHSGRRAFQLLHRRYPGSAWARRSPYYYDDPWG